MVQVTVGRWGDGLAVPLPGEIVQEAQLRDGQSVDIRLQSDAVVIRRTGPEGLLEELFRGASPEEWRALYADAYEWGPDRGRETVPE